MIEIHKVDHGSATELSELCSTSFTDAYRGVNSETDIQAYCQKNYSEAVINRNLSNPDVVYKVSYREGKPVGFYMMQNQSCPVELDKPMIELKQIYILASEFGTGLGKKLLDDVIRSAGQLGKKWVWLSVSDLNERAKSFYLRNAFKPVGPAPVLEVGNDRLPATVMAREL